MPPPRPTGLTLRLPPLPPSLNLPQVLRDAFEELRPAAQSLSLTGHYQSSSARGQLHPAALAQDWRVLSEQLAHDPLFAAQLAGDHAYEDMDYAAALVQAVQAYEESTGQPMSAPPAASLDAVVDSLKDVVESVATGPGEVVAGEGDLASELALLSSIVDRARSEGRPLELSEVIELALLQQNGSLGEALDLAAAAMQNVVRAPDFYLDYAATQGLDPAEFGLHTEGLCSSNTAGIGFMARYIHDFSGQAFGLSPQDSGLVPLPQAEDLVGIPYHNLDVLRLTLTNGLLSPELVEGTLDYYYGATPGELFIFGASEEKEAADYAAWRGALLTFDGSALQELGLTAEQAQHYSTVLGADHSVLRFPLARPLFDAFVQALGLKDELLPASEPPPPAPTPAQVSTSEPLPEGTPAEGLLWGDLGADGFPTARWLEEVQKAQLLPWRTP